MVRVVIFVIAILGIFAGTLVYGGERLDAWDQAEPPPPSDLQPITRPEEKKEKPGSGGSGSGVAAEQVTPEKARWIRETNALCRRARSDSDNYDEPETLGEAERLIVELQAKNREYNDAFAAITPAKGDRRQIAKLLELFDRDERLVEALLAALREGDAGELLTLNDRLTAVAARESDLLVGLGATDCDLGLLATTY
jgi:hypothetical protein